MSCELSVSVKESPDRKKKKNAVTFVYPHLKRWKQCVKINHTESFFQIFLYTLNANDLHITSTYYIYITSTYYIYILHITSVIFLGLEIDNKLNFEKHV